MHPAISAENLGKRYRISQSNGGETARRYKTLRDSLSAIATAPFRRFKNGGGDGQTEDFWALKDVSFEVKPGEVVGIIGRNGAGKSTLLKILSRITKPSAGCARIRGRVGSLLEVGTGFHPELTGRENIYLNASILGMSRREIDKQFDRIVSFSEVEKFLDTPVKRFSSGMHVRLAFAVAAHLEPEILIVDEVLAVGDQQFQKKCTQQMSEVSRAGRTVLLVSHDIPTIAKLCNRVMWIHDGAIKSCGPAPSVIEKYHAFAGQGLDAGSDVDLEAHPNRRARGAALLRRLRILNGAGEPTTSIAAGDPISFEVTFDNEAATFGHHIGIDLCDISGSPLGEWSTKTQSSIDLSRLSGGKLICRVDSLRLVPSDYVINVWVGDLEDFVEVVPNASRLTILPSDYFGTGKLPQRRCGPMLLDGSWVEGT